MNYNVSLQIVHLFIYFYFSGFRYQWDLFQHCELSHLLLHSTHPTSTRFLSHSIRSWIYCYLPIRIETRSSAWCHSVVVSFISCSNIYAMEMRVNFQQVKAVTNDFMKWSSRRSSACCISSFFTNFNFVSRSCLVCYCCLIRKTFVLNTQVLILRNVTSTAIPFYWERQSCNFQHIYLY